MTAQKSYSDKMPMFDIPDLKDLTYKIAIVFGVIIVIYGVLWLLVNLGVIPALIAAVFPQIVLIIIGLFIIYTAIDRRNKYY
jgi:vacuolar-type H+-ATPase subunit I/STV1